MAPASHSPCLSIGIVGAGPAGLAAAIALTRAGHKAQIFERFIEPRPIGAGLLLQPTGLACLARLGLAETAIATGARIDTIAGSTESGRTIFDVGYARLAPHLHGLGIHRASLFTLLHDEALRLGVTITPATDIAASQMRNCDRTLIDSEGRELGRFDLVIDAGGTRSALRCSHARIRLDRPYPFGAVWGVAPLPADWDGVHTLGQRYDGSKVMLGVLPIGKAPGSSTELAAMFWSLKRDDYEAWRSAGIDAWKSVALSYWPQIAPLLDSFRSADDMTMATYSDVILVSPVADRLVVIGDAAHSSSPQLGQGANLSLIDAVTLADCLAGATVDAAAIAAALARYARRRRRHVAFYQRASRWLTPFFQSDSLWAARLRDASFAPMGRMPFIRSEMVRTLAGMKTGLFSHMDPGSLHPRYGLRTAAKPATSGAVGTTEPQT